jgi:hypothetical protein
MAKGRPQLKFDDLKKGMTLMVTANSGNFSNCFARVEEIFGYLAVLEVKDGYNWRTVHIARPATYFKFYPSSEAHRILYGP